MIKLILHWSDKELRSRLVDANIDIVIADINMNIDGCAVKLAIQVSEKPICENEPQATKAIKTERYAQHYWNVITSLWFHMCV